MLPTILAQGIDNVPAPFLKSAMMLVIGACVALGGVGCWLTWFRPRKEPPRIEPSERTRRQLNVRTDMCDFKMTEVARRLSGHDAEIAELRATLNRAIRDFEGATERLEGTMGGVKETVDRLLEKALERWGN